MKKFYDTNAILELLDAVLDEPFQISSKTLEELESIKVSNSKTEELRYKARKACHLLDENKDKFSVVIANNTNIYETLDNFELPISPDNVILASAYLENQKEPLVFISNDVVCKILGKCVFGLTVKSTKSNKSEDEYLGYKVMDMTDSGLAYFYEHPEDNEFDCVQNEYVVLKLHNEVVDKVKWNGEKYISIKSINVKSNLLGSVKPMDEYQALTLDSFATNKISMVKGAAGSGKSYLAIGYLFSQLEKHKIDKIIVFCNTIATMGSAKLGYYPGTKDEKLCDSQIGNMLSSKLGDKVMMESLINEGKLVLLPMSDIRGYDTTNMNAGIYITEAQNLSVSLMKLAVQRIGEDCICIIDGDCKTQVDDINFAGSNNGMRRLSQVFKGTDVYGEVTLNKVYRSRIAEIAESM